MWDAADGDIGVTNRFHLKSQNGHDDVIRRDKGERKQQEETNATKRHTKHFTQLLAQFKIW
jgi:hypothetical protein